MLNLLSVSHDFRPLNAHQMHYTNVHYTNNTSISFSATKSHALLLLLSVAFHGDGSILFSPILHRDMCQADQEVRSSFVCILGFKTHQLLSLQWQTRPGGQSHDTVKPLASNGLDLKTTLLVDNEARKAVRGEETNVIELPTWEICEGIGFQSFLKTFNG